MSSSRCPVQPRTSSAPGRAIGSATSLIELGFYQLAGRRSGVDLAADDALEQLGPARIGGRALLELAANPRRGDPEHLGAQVASPAFGQRARFGDPLTVGVDRLEQLG